MKSLKSLFERQSEGEITMNQAYSMAIGDGSWTGSFKSFLTNAVDQGWADQGLGMTSSLLHEKFGTGSGSQLDVPCPQGFQRDEFGVCQELRRPMSTGAKIGILVGGLAVVGAIVYAVKNK